MILFELVENMVFLQVKKMHFIYITLMLASNLYTIKAGSSYLDIATGKSGSLSGPGEVETSTRITKNKKYLTPTEIIALDGYPAETHLVTTEDGYILTIFRIPGKNGSKPVYMQHGFLESGVDFVQLGRGRSLAYILYDKGYDVWLGNARGNSYSKKHINLTEADPKFWDFSVSEVGTYDLPAAIDYITKLTGKRLFYIGHSMGGTDISVMGIERPNIAKKVKAAIGLAPATYINHCRSLPLIALAPVSGMFYRVAKALNIHSLIGRSAFLDTALEFLCGSSINIFFLCKPLWYITAGYSPKQIESSLLPQITSKLPAGTGVKHYVHLLQQIHSSKTRFHKFDYGKKVNLKVYNSKRPPPYDLSKMRIPFAAFYAKNDIIVVPRDIKDFYNALPVKLGIFEVPDKLFNHLDYISGKDAHTLVYPTVLRIMSDFDAANNDIQSI